MTTERKLEYDPSNPAHQLLAELVKTLQHNADVAERLIESNERLMEMHQHMHRQGDNLISTLGQSQETAGSISDYLLMLHQLVDAVSQGSYRIKGIMESAQDFYAQFED